MFDRLHIFGVILVYIKVAIDTFREMIFRVKRQHLHIVTIQYAVSKQQIATVLIRVQRLVIIDHCPKVCHD